jgi:hypothetical protein
MNRILIIHVKRSGSTRLCKGLSEVLNAKHYPSPFRPCILNQPKDLQYYFNNSCILQTECVQYSDNLLENLIEGFGNVIFLTRKDIESAVESYAYIGSPNKQKNTLMNSYSSRYVWERTSNYEESRKEIILQEELLKQLSIKYNIKISYYEDLYYNTPVTTVKEFNLNIDTEEFVKKYLDTNLRQRIFTSGSIL